MGFSNSFALGIVIGGAVDATVGRSFRSLEQRAKESEQKLKKLTLGDALASDVGKYRTELLRLQTARKEGTHDSATLNRQIGVAMAKYRRASEKAREYGIDVKNLAKEQRDLAVQIGRTTRAMRRQQAGMKNREARRELGGQMLGAVGAAYAMTMPVRAAIEFESAMADVRKVVDFKEPDGLKMMGKTINRMSREIPISAVGLAQITAAGGQLGIKAPDLPDFTRTVAKMATAFDMLPSAAGESMAKLANVYQIPISEMGRLGDAVNHLSDNTAAKARDMVETLGRIGGTAKQFGLGTTQAAALSNAFIALGKTPEVAATAINALLLKLGTAEKQPKKFQQGLDAIGMSAEALGEQVKTDAQGALEGFLDAMGNVDESERLGVLSDLFGMEYSDDLALLVGGLGEYRKALNLVGKESSYSGSMTREFQIQSETTARRLQIFKNNVAELGIGLGSVLLPGINAVMRPLGASITTVAELTEKYPRLTQVVVGAAVGLVGLKIAALGGRYAFTFLSDGVRIAGGIIDFFRLSTLKTNAVLAVQKARAIGMAIAQRAIAVSTGLWTAAQWALNAAMSANPIGLIIAGVAALAVGAVWLYKKWEPFRKLVDWIWEGFKKLVEYSPLGMLIKAGKMVGKFFGRDDKKKARRQIQRRRRSRSRASRSAKRKRRGRVKRAARAVAVGAAVSASTVAPAQTAQATNPQVPGVAPASIAARTTHQVNNNQQYQIDVHARPGMDERAIAEQVRREIEKKEARDAARERGALHD